MTNSLPLLSSLAARRLRTIAAAVAAGCISGCVWYGVTPNPNPPPPVEELEAPEFVEMRPGMSADGHLDCPAGNCEAKYRIRVEREGRLSVLVIPTATSVPSDRVGFRATLGDSVGRILDQQRFDEEHKDVLLEQDVRAGAYFVMVQAIGGGVDFTVKPTLR